MKTLTTSLALALVTVAGAANADTLKAPSAGGGSTKATTSPTGPAASGTPSTPTVSKELDTFMTPYSGSWKCDSKLPGAMIGSPTTLDVKSSLTFTKLWGGFFWEGDFEIAKQKGLPGAISVKFYIGWDSGAKQVVMTGVDSMGGLYNETGKIEGVTLPFTGTAIGMGMTMKVRESMSLKDKVATHSMEVDMGKGWTAFGTDICRH